MTAGAILLADDEETFRESTARLCGEGFVCHCVEDAEHGVESLRQSRFDLLIADIRMPHNADMRIIREARKLDSHLPIIVVTGYSSAETAINSVEMAVDAYLTKPFEIDDLLVHVRKAVERSHVRQRLAAVVERLHLVLKSLAAEPLRPLPPAAEVNETALSTIRILACCLSDLLVLRSKPETKDGLSNLCDLLDCPQRPAHRLAILDAIEVLKQTKDNFKSKQLAELRTRLEHAVGII